MAASFKGGPAPLWLAARRLTDCVCPSKKLVAKRVRGETFGYLRHFLISCVSDVGQREAREVGEEAASYVSNVKKKTSPP
jgi:hypothetical protein